MAVTERTAVQQCNPESPRRSRNMAAIRSTGNRTTEVYFKRLLRENGISGWRRHYTVIGRPDFAFPQQRLAVFVDGCFWHGCNKCYIAPKHNAGYWAAKISGNRKRDKKNVGELQKKGWSVMRIWEHELKDPPHILSRLRLALSRASSTKSE